MDKAEQGARSRAALACLELAANALSQANKETPIAMPREMAKAHDAIGKLQLKLTAVHEKATGHKKP